MLVILGISKVAGGKVRIRVRRPQHTASAAKDYGSEQKARGAILKLGIAENLVDLLFKLLPDVGENAVLSFPPLEISGRILQICTTPSGTVPGDQRTRRCH